MPKRDSNYHGLLLVHKPGRNILSSQSASTDSTGIASANTENALPTSHDIVKMARHWCQQRRIGHTGTLDPMASGLLTLCLGSATRLVEYYQNHDKQYTAQVCLGHATDTYDAMGKVTASATIPTITQSNIEEVLAKFRGQIWQKPPLFSAIKQGGESLHRKARRGETVTVEPRQVTIRNLELLEFVPPDCIKLAITCSAGTYIRSLAHDLGHMLDSHAYLDRLRRDAAGNFTLTQAHSPAVISQAAEEGRLHQLILPIGYGLTMPTQYLGEEEILRFGYGQTVLLHSHKSEHPEQIDTITALAIARSRKSGEFVGIIRRLPDDGDNNMKQKQMPADQNALGIPWKAEKWFANK